MSYNLVILKGNLTRDPELREVGETTVTKFNDATNETWTDKSGEKREEVFFTDIEAWGRRGEVIHEYLAKVSPILVEGQLRLDRWEDEESGQKRSRHFVRMEDFDFCGDKGSGTNGNHDSEEDTSEDNVPF